MADPMGKNPSALKKSFRMGSTGAQPYVITKSASGNAGKTRYQVIRDAMNDRAKLTVLITKKKTMTHLMNLNY